MKLLKRRELITLLCGGVAWPLAARALVSQKAEQSECINRNRDADNESDRADRHP